jgi:hypothetical protein
MLILHTQKKDEKKEIALIDKRWIILYKEISTPVKVLVSIMNIQKTKREREKGIPIHSTKNNNNNNNNNIRLRINT